MSKKRGQVNSVWHRTDSSQLVWQHSGTLIQYHTVPRHAVSAIKTKQKKTQKSTPHTSSPLGSCMEFRKCSHMCVCVQSRRLAKPRTTQADRWALAGQRNAQPSRIRSDQMIRFILSYRIYPSPKGSAMPPRQTKTKSVDSSSSRPERETSWRTIPQVHLDDLRLRTACPACPSSGSQGLSRGGGPLAEGGSAARRS